MKFSILIDILFDLLNQRRLTAAYLAEKYQISPRTVYRYVEVLASKVPLHVKRGRSGGITLADNYTLPVNFMSETEYDAAIEALCIAYATNPNERFLQARRKFSAQKKLEKRDLRFREHAENIWIDEIDSRIFPASKKLRVLQECIRNSLLAEIIYVQENGEKLEDKIEPHTLCLNGNVWSMYAFSHNLRAFYTFTVGRIYAISKTEEAFRRRPLEIGVIPSKPTQETLTVRLECAKEALPQLLDWLGIEHLRIRNQSYIFEVELPKDGLAEKLLTYGTNIKVLAPKSLQTALLTATKSVQALYS